MTEQQGRRGLLGGFLGGSVDDIDRKFKQRIDEFGSLIEQLKPYFQKLTDAINENTKELRNQRH